MTRREVAASLSTLCWIRAAFEASAPRDLQPTQEFVRGGQQALASRGQSHRMSRAIKQARANPVLQGLIRLLKAGC